MTTCGADPGLQNHNGHFLTVIWTIAKTKLYSGVLSFRGSRITRTNCGITDNLYTFQHSVGAQAVQSYPGLFGLDPVEESV